jgi:hypothetical protein
MTPRTTLIASAALALLCTASTSAWADPPIADAGPDLFATAGATVQLDGSLSYDLDVEFIFYFWSQIAGPAALNITGADTFDPTVELPIDPGAELTFQLTAINQAGESNSDSVNIFISQESVPEPATFWLLGGMLPLLGAARLRKRSA